MEMNQIYKCLGAPTTPSKVETKGDEPNVWRSQKNSLGTEKCMLSNPESLSLDN